MLYREMAEELEDSGLFERRFLPLDFADLAGGDRSISAEPISSIPACSPLSLNMKTLGRIAGGV